MPWGCAPFGIFRPSSILTWLWRFLKAVGLQPSAPAACHMLPAPGPLQTVHITAACPARAPVTRLHHLYQGISPCAAVRVESVKPHRSCACTPRWTCTLHPKKDLMGVISNKSCNTMPEKWPGYKATCHTTNQQPE